MNGEKRKHLSAEVPQIEMQTGVTVWILNENTGCLEPDRVVLMADNTVSIYFPNLLDLDQ